MAGGAFGKRHIFLSGRGNILSTLDQKLLENVQKDFWEKYLNLHLQEFP